MKRTSAGVLSPLAGITCALLLATLPHPASAVVTSTWVVNSYKEFNEGEAKGSFITSMGEVKPGWATEKVDLDFNAAWSAVRAPDGALFLGTDDGGSVYRARGEKLQKIATIEDAVAIVSLALAKDGTLYAGTMPAGQVWAIDTDSGSATRVAELDGVETVWSLVLDAAGRYLYAGTGPEGKLFQIDVRSKRARPVFESGDKRIISLVATRDGGVWMGTSEKALVFRYDPKRKTTRAMADFSANEVTALAEYNGGVIAAANEIKEPSTSGPKTKQKVDKAKKEEDEGEEPDFPDQGSKPGADKQTPSSAKPPRKGKRKGKGALYRIRGDGQLQQLHALTATYFTTLAVTEDGDIFAGAGDKGRIYLVGPDESVSTAFDVEQRIVDQMAYHPGHGLAFTTADAGALYYAGGAAKEPVYVSDVFDADAPSRFGKLVWRGEGRLVVETRTGNTGEPGEGWSRWQAPRKIARGGGGSYRGKVTSPPGRYLQFRVKFRGGDDDVLRQVGLYHLPQNKPTRITEVEVKNQNGSQSKLRTMKKGAAKPRSPVIEINWKVDNDDGDATVYELAVRREGEVRWRSIPTGDDPLTETKFKWNSETFPDGYYRLRVTASDRQANSNDRALEHYYTTPLFLLDNQRPKVDALNVRYPVATARATDAMSAIAEMAWSVDDGEWRVGTTRDGLFDDPTEMLEIRLPDDLEPGVHTLAIRVADEAGNIGSASVTFRR